MKKHLFEIRHGKDFDSVIIQAIQFGNTIKGEIEKVSEGFLGHEDKRLYVVYEKEPMKIEELK